MTHEELIQEGLRRAAIEGDKQRAAEKEHNDKIKAERKKEKFEAEKERAETAKRNAADTYRTQISQQAFDFGSPEKNTTSQDKPRARTVADTYRTQMSQQAFDFGSPEKNTTSQDKSRTRTTAKSGASGGSGANPMKTGTLSPFNMKKGGSVSSASKRADGCAVRGKTKA
jgi:hypothetical protein